MIDWDLERYDIGEIVLSQGTAFIGDPRYSKENLISLNVRSGIYDVEIYKDGKHNAGLILTAKGAYINKLLWSKLDESVLVGSGMAGVYETPMYYEAVCDLMDNNDDIDGGCYSTGCVCSSGCGDGVYSLYVQKTNDIIVGILIAFIEDERESCNHCGNLYNETELSEDGYCNNCEDYEPVECEECQNRFERRELEDGLCEDCIRIKEEEE